MKTQTTLALSIAAALLSGNQALALGIGEINVSSQLGAPLNAEIPLSISQSESTSDIKVDVPAYREHQQLGLTDPVLPRDVRSSILTRADGKTVIRLTTLGSVNEPMLKFLVRVDSPAGQVVREYAILLDPPLFAYPGKTLTQAATISSVTDTNTAPLKTIVTGADGQFLRVQAGDTLFRIARNAYPGLSAQLDQVSRLLFEKNRDAFLNNNPNLLMLGSTLNLPSPAHMQMAMAPIATPVVEFNAANTPAAHTYTVKAGDTLYAIARRMSGAETGNLGTTVRRLFETNPQAFANDNIDHLLLV